MRTHSTAAGARPAIAVTRDPRQALAWLQAGQQIRIDSLNLRDHLRHIRALAQLQAAA